MPSLFFRVAAGLFLFCSPLFASPAQEVQLSGTTQLESFQKLIHLEPTVQEVHKQVTNYSQLNPSMTKRWHFLSRLKTLLPDVSIGHDISRSNNIDLDRGGTRDPDQYILGPENRSKGFDFDVSWDLGDILWSSSQTSIDSRDKIMANYRHDLLSEATRIYYDRRRIQTTLVFSPQQTHKEHLEQLIRMDELTALLDAMTNGFFSHKLDEIYKKFPELRGLWAPHPNIMIH